MTFLFLEPLVRVLQKESVASFIFIYMKICYKELAHMIIEAEKPLLLYHLTLETQETHWYGW